MNAFFCLLIFNVIKSNITIQTLFQRIHHISNFLPSFIYFKFDWLNRRLGKQEIQCTTSFCLNMIEKHMENFLQTITFRFQGFFLLKSAQKIDKKMLNATMVIWGKSYLYTISPNTIIFWTAESRTCWKRLYICRGNFAIARLKKLFI